VTATEERPPEHWDSPRKGHRMLNEDGLVDVALGAGLLSAALYMRLDPAARVRLAVVAALVPLAIVLVMGAIRRRLTYPRIGKARLPAVGAVPGLSIALTALFFAGLMAFIVLGAGRGAASLGLMWLLRGLLLAAAAALVALGLRTGLARFHVHAGVIVLSVFGAWLLLGTAHAAAMVMVAVPGAVLLITGIAVLVRFLHRCSLPT
jgi:hypothetical protein